MYSYIEKIEERLLEGFDENHILEEKEILLSLIKLTDIYDLQLNEDLIALSLKLLRKCIELENVDCTTSAANWDYSDWSKYDVKITEKQNLLADLDIVGLVCRLIIQNQSSEAVLVGIAALLGGNYKLQMKFLEFMQEDKENAFMATIFNLIESYFNKVRSF